jgi:DNA-binding XRE family transcriptional regulator
MNEQAKETVKFNNQAWADARPKHISRRAFAREIGTTDSNLIAIEKGRSTPSLLLAFKYCLATRLPIEQLCSKN